MTIKFTSGFASHIEAMLEWRTALGYSRSMAYPMLNFDRFCAARHPEETVLTRELAAAWCQHGPRVEWPAYKAHAIRAFGKYLRTVGIDAFVLPAEWISSRPRSLPHLFTDAELTAFFRAADSITPDPASPFRQYTIPVVFRLMLGCGLRPQEARRLRRRDVDTGAAIVTIEQSKRNKDRRVPVDMGLAGLLTRFDELANLHRPGREFFFEDHPGQPYPARWLTASYHRCRAIAGGIAPGSTPCMLRHNYATRTLTRWVQEGRDLNAWLPYLSAYMGHDTCASTAYYIHLLPERLAATRTDQRRRDHPAGQAMTRHADSFYRHLREWFTVFLPRQRAVSPHTITACRHSWNMLLGYVADTRQVPLDRVTFEVLDRACITGFLDHMRATRGWTATTHNQRLACIRSFFRYAATAEPALAMHLADVNGIPQLKSPATTPVRYLTTTAITAPLAAPDPDTKIGLRDQFFLILTYDLAARNAEMLALTVGDIDTKRLTAELVGKGSRPRRLPITAETAAHYRRYSAAFHPDADPGQPLFYTIHGHRKTRMSDDNLARFLRQHADTARQACPEIPSKVHPHMLRHSRAMHLYQAGMPLALLTEWLGHADPETTLIYAHADTEMKRQALAKAATGTSSPPATPIWHGREDIIQRLCGLAS